NRTAPERISGDAIKKREARRASLFLVGRLPLSVGRGPVLLLMSFRQLEGQSVEFVRDRYLASKAAGCAPRPVGLSRADHHAFPPRKPVTALLSKVSIAFGEKSI